MSAPRRSALLKAYVPFTGRNLIEELEKLASALPGRRILHLHSYGFAEDRSLMVHRLGTLMESLGVQVRWDVLVGTERFFETIRAFRQALQGDPAAVSPDMFDVYQDCLKDNAGRIYWGADYVVVHDFQPMGLVDARLSESKWIWRSHLDVSRADPGIWSFFSRYLRRYDAAVFSHPKLGRKLPVPRVIIPPSIDPLHERNVDLSPRETERTLSALGVPTDRPIVLAGGLPDDLRACRSLWKPLLVLARRLRFRLVIAAEGSVSESPAAIEEIRRDVEGRPGTHLILLAPTSHQEANALGRAASVVLRAPSERGIGIPVLEHLWRGKPVVVGPRMARLIPLEDGETGFVARSLSHLLATVEHLVGNARLARRVGLKARHLVGEHYLILRHVRDHLSLYGRLAGGRV